MVSEMTYLHAVEVILHNNFLSLKSLLIKSYPVGLHLLSLAMSCFGQDIENLHGEQGLVRQTRGPELHGPTEQLNVG